MFSQQVADEICRRLAEGETLRQICKPEDGFPSPAAVCAWAIGQNGASPSFPEQYARARSCGLDVIADQILHIADTTQLGEKVKVSEGKTEITTGDMIEHRKLQVDARKWLLSKLRPEKYGDKTQLVGGAAEGDKPLILQVVHIKPAEE